MPEIHQCTCPICQREADAPERAIHHQINVLMSRLDEQQRRWYAALEAQRYDHGGIKRASQITGLDPSPEEARNSTRIWPRVHATAFVCPGLDGLQRKKKVEAALLELVAPEVAGDPKTGVRWTARSLSRIKQGLGALGHRLSRETIRCLLYKHKIRPKSSIMAACAMARCRSC